MTDKKQIGYIITGHTGGVGQELVSFALKSGHKVIGISRSAVSDRKYASGNSQVLELQCDFLRNDEPMLSEGELNMIDEMLTGCHETVYIANAGQNTELDRSANEILSNVLKLVQVNTIGQLKLVCELLSYKANMINKCVFIGSYLTFFGSANASIGYTISKMILQELAVRYQDQTDERLKIQAIVLGGVDTAMNRASEIDKSRTRKWLSGLFRMSPEKAARSIIEASESSSAIKFIPFLPAIMVTILYYGRCLFRVPLYLLRR